MSLICKPCMATPAEVDGEYVCTKCGRVFGSVETAGIEEIHSHHVYHVRYESAQLTKHALKLVTALNLPEYALQTVLRVATELNSKGVRQRQALIFAMVYACREHNIPRLLIDVLEAMRQVYGSNIADSSASLIRMLNRTSQIAYELGLKLKSADTNFYLKAYLARIQDLVTREAGSQYYEYLRIRAAKNVDRVDNNQDASRTAREAITSIACRTLQTKLENLLREV